jgi:hypothetical protein
MASTTFLPDREAELVTWSTGFNTKINATPTTYGLTAGQATAYTTVHTAFVTAFNAANSDATNSRSAIVTKNAAKAVLIASARQLAGIIQSYPGTTNAMRSDLGLTVRDTQPTPVPPPANPPDVDIVSVSGNTVKLRLHDSTTPARRGKPAGVSGAAVFSFVGAAAPTDEGAWTFEGNTSKTVIDIVFPGTVAPGAKVWFTAFWFNQRKQEGPASAPVTTNIPGGGAMAA